jgi:hypothetical protein
MRSYVAQTKALEYEEKKYSILYLIPAVAFPPPQKKFPCVCLTYFCLFLNVYAFQGRIFFVYGISDTSQRKSSIFIYQSLQAT